MSLAPKPEDVPRISGALRFYQVASYITGVMLLLLIGEMIVKYGMHYELYAFSDHGVFAFVPWDESGQLPQATGVNLSTGILIAHGWLYVVYLFADFRLWSLMRWPFLRFVLIALGGVVPFLSFIAEALVAKQVKTFLRTQQPQPTASAEVAS